jgi:23S rRNA (cytosine1962-C5)-methyltransferase
MGCRNITNYSGQFWSSKVGAKAGWKMQNVQSSTLHNRPLNWEMEYNGIKFLAMPTPFRHLGFFPEQAVHWDFREIKRGNKYDAVIMDPPKFGRGPKGETWQIEKDLSKLLLLVRKVLSDKPLFVILNSYAIDSSSLSLSYALENAMKGL